MWQWLSQLEGAQSGLVGSFAGFVFGITALILGALFNFRLNRRRDALLQAEEADAVAAALFGEIILIRKELARTANLVARREMANGSFDKHFLELIRLQDPLLYKALANKLGLLDPAIILAITHFHANVEIVRAWLPHLVKTEERDFSYSPLTVLEPAIEAVEGIKPTIDALAVKMGVESPTDGLDIGAAHAVTASERESFTNK